MTLDELRKQIDDTDEQIVQLLVKRMELVTQIGEIKQEQKLPTLNSQREAQVLEKVTKLVDNLDYCSTIAATYQDIMKHSRAYQDTKKPSNQ